jgi:hypothetical protein
VLLFDKCDEISVVEYSFYEVLYPDYFYGFSAINMFVGKDKANCLCHREICLSSLEFK